MEENQKLHSLCNRKRNSVPRSLAYWLYFKRHLLEKEEVRMCFGERPLDLPAFKHLLWRKANPLKFGPSFCRRKSAKTNQRNIEDLQLVAWQYYLALLHPSSPVRVAPSASGGLGLFLREGVRVRAEASLFGTRLWGVLFEISEADFQRLRDLGYPSLYRSAIMGGPLSLANHQCRASLAFSVLACKPSTLRLYVHS